MSVSLVTTITRFLSCRHSRTVPAPQWLMMRSLLRQSSVREGLRRKFWPWVGTQLPYPIWQTILVQPCLCRISIASSESIARISSSNQVLPTVIKTDLQFNISKTNQFREMPGLNVGIDAIEIYFPKTYVSQQELEIFDAVPQGKYTIGLGQKNMSFVYEFEDVNSMALTAVSNLLKKHAIDPASIGRLEVGTETILDKSKSIKTTLMRLFPHTNIEGVSSINACYGGTNALFNTINWMQSESWDGRLAIVVCVDVAVYAKGPARPTGGAGAIAMLIAPNATFVMEKERTTHMSDQYDFYKPNLSSEYPIVDGQLSIQTYLAAIDDCWARFKGSRDFDFFCFHSPYHKMVQKSYARISESGFKEKVLPTCLVSIELGNIYTGSLYAGLVSLIEAGELLGRRIFMFSYGSGCAASLFALRCTKSTASHREKQQIKDRLSRRVKVPCSEYDRLMQHKQLNFNKHSQEFQVNPDLLFDDTFYLQRVDEKWRRFYQQLKSPQQSVNYTSSSANAAQTRLDLLNEQLVPHAIQSTIDSKRSQYNSLWAGFYKKTIQQRLDQVKKVQNVDVEYFKDGGLSLSNANLMIENCIGKIALPIGLGLNFLVNGNYYTIPMAIEEPSVIAAASSAAKTIADAGNGFEAFSTRPVMMGQIQLLDAINHSRIECLIDSNKTAIINRANQACASMVKRGGGVEDVKVRILAADQMSLDIYINVCDSMGANLVNTVLEHIAPLVQEITECRIGIKILTNLCLSRKVTAQIKLPISKLGYKEKPGLDVAKMIVEAYKFAELDIFRAVTHNKGIINGVEAVCNATGQDGRAVSASLHGFAALNGKYTPLSKYWIQGDYFFGELSVPISVGTQGGVLHQNPIYQQVLSILDYPDSQKLAELIVCVGLASNFAALRALAVEGIQRGHMGLHARNLAVSSGIPDHLVEEAVQFMKNRGSLKKETAEEFLKAYNVYQEIQQARGKQPRTLCTFSGSFILEGSDKPVELHVVFDCNSIEPIDLNFSSKSEITEKIFGQKGQEWMKNLFSVLNVVRLDQELDSLPKKSLTVKMKLLAVLIDLLSSNMLALDLERASSMIQNFLVTQTCDFHFTDGDVSLRYGLALLCELVHIFEYNLEQFVGNPTLRKALRLELYQILRSNVRCYELWEYGKRKEFNLEEFWGCRKKRLACTMMLLCDCINLKSADEKWIMLVEMVGDLYEMEMTLERDISKWRDSRVKDPNVYSYWLMQQEKLTLGEESSLVEQFKSETRGLIEQKRQKMGPQLPESLKHLSARASKAVKSFYSQKARL